MAIKLARTELILVQGGKLVKFLGWWLTPSLSNTPVLFYSFSSCPYHRLLRNYIIFSTLIILILYQVHWFNKTPNIFDDVSILYPCFTSFSISTVTVVNLQWLISMFWHVVGLTGVTLSWEYLANILLLGICSNCAI